MSENAKAGVYKKLSAIQVLLKAPKSQFNSFAKYYYRSCEDITEAVKPLLKEVGATLTLHDTVILIGDRYYIQATATLTDIDTGESASVSAMAREEESKKGNDAAQLTGATSSYARKYALSGLFALDDTKDSDFTNTGNDDKKADKPKKETAPARVQVGPAKDEAPPLTYQCADCGKPFQPFTDRSGRVYDAATVWQIARDRNVDGIARCKDCREKAGTTKEG